MFHTLATRIARYCAVAPTATPWCALLMSRPSQPSEMGVTFSPGMRSKWRALALPTRQPTDTAVAATIRSCDPISVPDEARLAHSLACVRAARMSKGSAGKLQARPPRRPRVVPGARRAVDGPGGAIARRNRARSLGVQLTAGRARRTATTRKPQPDACAPVRPTPPCPPAYRSAVAMTRHRPVARSPPPKVPQTSGRQR